MPVEIGLFDCIFEQCSHGAKTQANFRQYFACDQPYVNRQYTVASLTFPTTMYYLLTTTRTFDDNREKKEVTTSLRKTKNVNNITICHILLIAYLFTI